MTAILRKIRMLEASRDSGALTDEDFSRAKARLFDEVEDAIEADAPDVQTPDPEPVPIEPETAQTPRPRFTELPAQSVWHVVALCTALLTMIGLLVYFVLGDVVLAGTVVLTLVAAISVRVVQILDE